MFGCRYWTNHFQNNFSSCRSQNRIGHITRFVLNRKQKLHESTRFDLDKPHFEGSEAIWLIKK